MSEILPGTQVEARGLSWEVVHSEPAGAQRRYRLRCLQGALRGQEIDLLHPLDAIRPVTTDLDPEHAGRLRPWRLYHDAFLLEQALGPSAFLAVQPGRLDIAPYQLVPVMRVLQMSRPRLLLADGVGLGKTVEAGLVIAELIARRRAHRVLVVSPAGPLLEQWQHEMRERFGLRFRSVRSAGELQELRRSLVLGANPFDHVSYCLTSLDFAKQEKILLDLERTSWDLVVIDEAHHCVRLGGAGEWEDSRRRRLAEVLARQSDGLLLLTATPHDGYDAHFASLIELLDPSLVDGRGVLRGDHFHRHVVRRLKHHIRDPRSGTPLFVPREVHPRAVTFDRASHPAFALFQEALLATVAPRLRQAVRRRRFGEVLAFVALLKRSASTVAACRNTLAVVRDHHLEMLQRQRGTTEERRQRLRTLREYERRLARFGALSFEEEEDRAALEAEDMAAEITTSGLEDVAARIGELRRQQRRERAASRRIETTCDALDALVEMATAAEAEDPKLRATLEELRAIREQEPDANILVYTEYTDSQDALLAFLLDAVKRGDLSGEVLSISGRPEHAHERATITERFATERGLVLVSTDATAEGLNLHQRCHHLIHLELPYNPNRIEQRNGRIDRYGQTRTPQIRYLYLAGTFEERLLLRLVAKVERQRTRLTYVPDTLGGITTDEAQSVRLLEGLAEEEHNLFRRPPHTLRRIEDASDEDVGVPAYEELLAEVERAMAGYEKVARTSAWLAGPGLGAEVRHLDAARQAHEAGRRLGAVDLTTFVCEALIADTADPSSVERPEEDPDTLVLRLPSMWIHGLSDLPGYEPNTRTLRLTTDRHRTRDSQGRPLGYLGRAHPIVRRALDRVRNLRFGEARAWIDRRVSAVEVDGAAPALLFTFLGVLESSRGHELERVLAVRTSPSGDLEVFAEPEGWLALVDGGEATGTRGLWARTFASWGDDARARAAEAARVTFEALAGEHLDQLRVRSANEVEALDGWLRARAEAICGPVEEAQAELFGAGEAPPEWRSERDARVRLASFATDGSRPPAARREADGVLRLYRLRRKEIDARAHAEIRPPVLLGLLMLVPSGDGAS